MLVDELYEQQLDELNWKDIQRGANKFTKGLAKTGDRVAGAASAVGGAAKELGRQAIARPVSAAYGAAKSGLSKAADVTKDVYKDVRKGAQTAAKGVSAATSDIGRAGSWAGKELAKAAKGVSTTVGAAAGVPQGMARAAQKGYRGAVSAIGGKPVPATGATTTDASATKQIRTQSGSINPATGRAWTPDELRTWASARGAGAAAAVPVAPAAATTTVPAAKPDTTAADQQSAVTVRQINKAIPTLRSRDLKSVKRVVDATLAAKPTRAPRAVAGKAPAISIGGQKVSPRDPNYATLVKKLPPQFMQSKKPAPVSETVREVMTRLRLAQSSDDLRTIKEYIERDFARRGVVTESVIALRDSLIDYADTYYNANQSLRALA